MNPRSGYYRRLLEVLAKTPADSPLNRCSAEPLAGVHGR
jgi:hypothetical protein